MSRTYVTTEDSKAKGFIQFNHQNCFMRNRKLFTLALYDNLLKLSYEFYNSIRIES